MFDLCDDGQAVIAGLSPDALDEARYQLAIDCGSSRSRYGYVPPGDTLHFADSETEAAQRLGERAAAGGDAPPAGMLMGQFGPSWRELGLALSHAGDGFGLARASVHVAGGATRGLFVNVSDEVAHRVVVAAGGVLSRHPLSVQPGETSAFELPTELTTAQLATLTISAAFVGRADPGRALNITGTPGDWSGPKQQLEALRPPVDLTHAPATVDYFETQLWFQQPTSHPLPADAEPVLRDPVVVVAALNPRHEVVAVLRPIVVMRDGKHTPVSRIALDEMPSVGFVRPPDAGLAILSAGAADSVPR